MPAVGPGGPRRRPRAAGRGVAGRHRRTTRRASTARPSRSPTPGPRCSCPTPPPPGTRSTSSGARVTTTPTLSVHAPCTACSSPTRSSSTAGRVAASPTPCATRPCPVTEVDWRPPMPGTEADLAPGHRRPAPRAPPTPARCRRMLAGRGRASSTSCRPPRRSASSPASSCTPARRSSWDRASGPLRGALIGAMLLRGPGRHRRGRRDARSPQATVRPSSRATTAAPSARWPAWSRPSMWMFVLRDDGARPRRRAARSTRASARCCATAPTAPR